MSDKELARRVELQLTVSGVKLPANINKYIQTATYTDNEEDNADDFQIVIDDRENKWLGDWICTKPSTSSSTNVEKKTTKEKTIKYIVKRGDTLSSIAQKYLGSASKADQIESENNIKNPKLIYPGQVLNITTGGTTTTTVSNTASQAGKAKMITAILVQKNWNDTGKDAILNCGTFEIDGIDASGPPMKITLKATSIPYTSTMRKQLKTRAWEKINLKGIATQMGKDNGLKVLYLADDNPVYKRKEQVRKSDIKFLQKLCKAAGMALKVTTKTIVIFDTAEYESKPHIKTIKYGDSDIISFKFGTSLTDTAYTKCHVSYTNPDTKQTIEYTYTPSSTEGTGQTLEINEKVSSTEEAKKLAKKRLREKNAQEFTASFTMVGNVSLVAGATIKVKGFQEFDRKYIITKATHKLIGGYTTDIDLKQVLEGY